MAKKPPLYRVTVGRTSLRSKFKLSRKKLMAIIAIITLAGIALIINSFAAIPVYNGKLIGINAFTYDLQSGALQQLHVNSLRGELTFSGRDFSSPSYDGTTTEWINATTSNGIVPLPLLNRYAPIHSINPDAFAAAVVKWCQTYCSGGTFYDNNTSANPAYAPHILEILNEPYREAWGYPVTLAGPNNDADAYAILLAKTRSALDDAGLRSIGILGSAEDLPDTRDNWNKALINNGAFTHVQGIVMHPYGPVDLKPGTLTPLQKPDPHTSAGTVGWSLIYSVRRELLAANKNLPSRARNATDMYITEDGWCLTPPRHVALDPGCNGATYSEDGRQINMQVVLKQLATTSWIKGFWYFNLHPYSGNTFGLDNAQGEPTAGFNNFATDISNVRVQYAKKFSLDTSFTAKASSLRHRQTFKHRKPRPKKPTKKASQKKKS